NTPGLHNHDYEGDSEDEEYYRHCDTSKWSKRDFNRLKKTLEHCIKWIRFFQICPQEFAEYVFPFRQILPEEIIRHFLRQRITGHMPISSIAIRLPPPRIPSTDINSTI